MCKYACLILWCTLCMASTHAADIALGDDCTDAPVCFTPNPLPIRVGESVRFFIYCSNDFHGPHNVVADDGSFRCARGCDGEGGDGKPVGCNPGWEFTRKFNTPGLVQFHDEVDLIKGAIIVSTGPVGSVVEFYNPQLDQYFVTADPIEQAYVDTGASGNWQRTGESFKSGGSTPVCRFGGNTVRSPVTGRPWGPNSHFYTADAGECVGLKKLFDAHKPSWLFESNDFVTTPAGNTGCATNLLPVYRAYNDGYGHGRDANHRLTTNAAAYQATIGAGWIGEGVVMCAPQ